MVNDEWWRCYIFSLRRHIQKKWPKARPYIQHYSVERFIGWMHMFLMVVVDWWLFSVLSSTKFICMNDVLRTIFELCVKMLLLLLLLLMLLSSRMKWVNIMKFYWIETCEPVVTHENIELYELFRTTLNTQHPNVLVNWLLDWLCYWVRHSFYFHTMFPNTPTTDCKYMCTLFYKYIVISLFILPEEDQKIYEIRKRQAIVTQTTSISHSTG